MDNAQQLATLIQSLGFSEEKASALFNKLLADRYAGIIEDARKGIEPKTTTIVLNHMQQAVGKVEGHKHPLFDKVLKCVNAGLNVLLIGPAGCGKSYLTWQLAQALGRRYGVIHGTAGASESHLQGWLLPIGQGGQFTYVPAEFVECFEEGNSLFTLDELDAFDPNMLIVMNGALANNRFHIPQRYTAPHVERGPNQAIVATANTFGTGADIMYAGRNQLDAATLDRFYPIVMDYDKAYEQQVAMKQTEILDWCWRMREKVQVLKLRRVISTRTIQKSCIAVNAGLPWAEVKRDILTGWTRDELAKCGEIQS